MSTLATRTDADVWHTCSGQLQVGADGKPFTPASAGVAGYSQAAQHCLACKRLGSCYVRYRPVVLNPPTRASKPKPKRDNNTRRRSPPPQCNRASDAADTPSYAVSDHELGPNPPLTEQQERALEAALASEDESDTWHGYDAYDEPEKRASSPHSQSSTRTVATQVSNARGLRRRPESSVRLADSKTKFDAPPPAAARFRIRHAHHPSEPDEDTDHGTCAQQTFRGGLHADVPAEDDFYEDDFYGGGFPEEDSVR
ncbi:hypothetical protein AAVH_11979 [Aphelenchoides avenae]|nr:hypothetical protein AAVH_11978 [Aphelenchus avenae]KAH7720552.1 hypothetical protein AAVH_11979 [Aphelenchus avenae]